ncbi:hypothetical protein MSG28_014057 [Choristoneura fumiferana]|uniref:Uncharacterized protein n=1 Tax=Choristoneura fumiferana TaxID=7141 RepID=A0ACC0JFX4_CHOFU|nr:hypothetical protein MSG28_014057 [Choristoneura fumiferana]
MAERERANEEARTAPSGLCLALWLALSVELKENSFKVVISCTNAIEVPALSRRPEPYYGRMIGRLSQYAHGIRGAVYAVDESTVFVKNFAYDGTGPDAYFWVGDTPQPSPEGVLVPYPEDYTTRDPPILTAHSNSDIMLRLPGGKRLRDIKWLSVWCRRFTRLAHGLRSGNISVLDAKTFYIPNLHYDGAGEDIEIQLPGKLTAYDVDWLAVWCVEYRHNFGHVYIPKDLDVPPALGQTKITVSKGMGQSKTSSTTSQTPASASNNCKEILDKRLQVRWELQCDGERGVCPDLRLGGSNDAVLGQQKNGVTTITYRRPLAAKESQKDKEVLTSRSQSNDNTCLGLAELDAEGPAPWPPRVLAGLTNFTARIGPAGGRRGYTPITGHPSWGIAWYINDQLIPEIYVERGKTYTFTVEGGEDRTNPANDSSEGGFGQKKEEDQRKQRLFAGVAFDNEGYPYPTAAVSESFEAYMKTLQLECNEGEPAILTWTVAQETPDLVYYQCYTHNNLGWKIHVVDPGTSVPFPGDQTADFNAATVLLPTVTAILTILTVLRNIASR